MMVQNSVGLFDFGFLFCTSGYRQMMIRNLGFALKNNHFYPGEPGLSDLLLQKLTFAMLSCFKHSEIKVLLLPVFSDG